MIENMVKYLSEKYPTVYGKGIRCGAYIPDEWLPIIEELSQQISDELIVSGIEDFTVDQIKEKFGGLRYYVTNSNQKIDEMIVEAEKKVAKLERGYKC